ncbi:MAG: outer membrane lipid asymmetry maintenance protein MlaD [Rickettsiales bacterium]|nr:outer membrane lipid asymmetry maintenance protein MlaD [Rickettsiales bacterium]|tara:strand:+ start:13032 stop:13496 length:465 start_codon:yes stop_codon:yes gene_type:complete
MQSQFVEALIGTFVLALAGYILWFGYTKADTQVANGYKVSGFFTKVDGINKGSDVKMSGIKVGTVSGLEIDPKSFMAKVMIQLPTNLKVPLDSSLAVVSDGLLGGKYLAITPGGDEENLKDGDVIEHTQSSINLESLIGQMVFSQDKKEKKNDA